MHSKVLFLLFPLAMLFIVSCGGSASNDGAATATAPATTGKRSDENCATSASNAPNGNQVLFGDPVGGGDSTRVGGNNKDGGGCLNRGLCEPISVNSNAIPVGFQYTQGTVAGNPSILVMMFKYAQLFQKQPEAAVLFYNNTGSGSGPIANYQFAHNFALSQLGGNFANVCGTINATPAGAGVITYNPALVAPFPPNANMNGTVTVTYTVTP